MDALFYLPAIPLYLIARNKFGNEFNAFLFALSYLFYTVIFTPTFETLSLFSGLFIIAYYFYSENRIVAFLIFFLLSLSTMEFAPVLGGMFGLIIILAELSKRNLKGICSHWSIAAARGYLLGFSLIVVSVVFFLVDFKITYYFSANTHSVLMNLYGTNVTSTSSILQGLRTATAAKIGYISATNVQYLFLSLLDPIALMQIPWYLAIWISIFPYYSVYYNSYTFPFVVLGAVAGISRIGSLAANKKLIIRIFTLIILVTMIVSWVGAPTFALPSNVGSSGLGVLQVAEALPTNASVFSDVNAYPIISSVAWDTTDYGQPRNFTVFSASNGPPYSLNGYGLYAASGSYVAYEKNYSSAPEVNSFYYETQPKTYSVQGVPFYFSGSVFLPKGDYIIEANITQRNGPGIETINAGSTQNEFFPVTQDVIQEFTVNKTISVSYIVVDVSPSFGYYGFGAKLTTSMSPFSTAIVSNDFSDYYYNVNHIELNGPFTLNANTTYFLWVGTYGYPGGISVPIANGNGLYQMNTSTNVITKQNGSMQFSIVGNIPEYVPKPTIVDFTFQNGGENIVRTIAITKSNSEMILNATSEGGFSVFSFLSDYAYGSFRVTSLVIKTPGAVEPHSTFLGNIDLTLVIALVPSYVIVTLAFTKFKSSHLKKVRARERLTNSVLIFLGSVFSLFYLIFALGYYRVVPSLYKVEYFAIFGYVISLSILAYLTLCYLTKKKGET
jgi:uncharacterized membrane protein